MTAPGISTEMAHAHGMWRAARDNWRASTDRDARAMWRGEMTDWAAEVARLALLPETTEAA